MNNDIPYILISLFNLILIYWISIKAIRQVYVKMQNPVNETQHSITYVNVLEHIQGTKCFLNPDFTIIDLARALDIHPKMLSGLIKQNANQNFNSFINQFRVEETKTMLLSIKKLNLSIEGIGNEAGFKSKSAFYRAFKQFENTTPGQYIS